MRAAMMAALLWTLPAASMAAPDAQAWAQWQQQQQQQQAQGVVYSGDTHQQAARSNRLADALGGAAIAKIGGGGQKPTAGAPVAKPEAGDKGAPPPQQQAVNKSLNPNAAKGRGKTQAELDEEQRRLLAEQMRNMPGNDGMA